MASSIRLHVSTRKGLFTYRRAGRGAWRLESTSFLGDNVTLALPDPRDGRLYAALNLGHFGVKLRRSADGGRNWEELASPAYPAKPEGEEDVSPMSGQPVPWKLILIWSLEPGLASEPGVLWCGTIPGGLFRSEDSGASWQLMESLWHHPMRKAWFGGGYDNAGIHSVCVDPRDAARVRVGVSCGGVWTTRDRGATWECQATGMRAAYLPPEVAGEPNQQDPHRLVQCPKSPEHLWVQHHNGIFRSTDDCASWQEIHEVPVSSFGFAVAVHPQDPNTAWFVPATKDEQRFPVDGKVVVTRTRDGGKTFETLRQGLPQQDAYDLVYRHALDIDASGQCLAFGSTTGGLWISEDQGDSWAALNEHLPPVHAVRFENP